MKKVKVAVLGASGYAGEELLRILLRHPGVEIVAITSRKNAGEPVSAVFEVFENAIAGGGRRQEYRKIPQGGHI